MQWTECIPAWEGKISIALILLCLAMICFPFSVAATNLFLGLLLALGILGGFWWQGVRKLWTNYRLLLIALITYLALVPIGLLWSLDPDWGGRILTRHWFWLLLPIVVMVLISERHRNTFLTVMSFALTANLVYCVLQAYGLIESPTVAGSTMDNATGHIGHTSFGFFYGVWAAWLIHLGLLFQNDKSWLLWGLASWALVMVFMAQGKSGYVVTLVAMLIVAAKWLKESRNRKIFASFAAVVLLLTLFLAFGPGKERLLATWDVLTGSVAQNELNSSQENAVSSVTARLEWWKMSYDIWLAQPVLGVGTGGFPQAAADWQAEQVDVQMFARSLAHPHNQYLLAMVRWGAVGLLLLMGLLYFWIRSGISVQWRDSVAMPLLALTGAALLIHGLSSASMEEHFSTIFAVLLAGTGLSESISEKS